MASVTRILMGNHLTTKLHLSQNNNGNDNMSDSGEAAVFLNENNTNNDSDVLTHAESAVFAASVYDEEDVVQQKTLSTYEATVNTDNTSVGAGNHFSLFLKEGVLYASGENILSQLGIGVEGYDIKTPVEVTMPEGFDQTIVSTSAGLIHSAFLTADGDVYTWGYGLRGRLGHGNDETRTEPTKIAAFDDINIVKIAMGNGASYAIDDNGTLYAWGQNSNGQLGMGNEEHLNLPTVVEALAQETIIDVSPGTSHVLVLTDDGEVYSFGSNIDGQLGSPDGLDTEGNPVREILSPVLVTGLPDDVLSITADGKTSYAVTESGHVYGWGENRYGQIQVGTDNNDGTITVDTSDVLQPTMIQGLPDSIIDVKAGARWVVALTEDGDVYAWGPDDEGPSGGLDGDLTDDTDDFFTPTKIAAWDNLNIVEIATAPNSVIAVTDTGEIYSFGSNSDGRLGYADASTVLDPQQVDFSSDSNPFLVSTTPNDNDRDVDAAADFTFIFTEEIFAGEASIRIVNRDDATDVFDIDVTNQKFVSFEGDTAVVQLSDFLTGDARYAVEFDTGAFVDADNNAVEGFESGDTSSFNFSVAEFDNAAPISAVGDYASNLLRGADGDDSLIGKGGDDLIFGNDGSDILRGNQGDDLLNGGQGDDFLHGGRNHDTLFGGEGNDQLVGGKERDYLDGGQGDDTLTGGKGSDIFTYTENSGHDEVTDFQNASSGWFWWSNHSKDADTLSLDVEGFDSKWDLLSVIEREGQDLVFRFDEDNSLTLENTNYWDLLRMDIDFL